MRRNFKKFGIIALLLIFLAVTVAGKFSFGGISDFIEDAEGKLIAIIIVSIISGIMGVIDTWIGPDVSSWPNPQLTGPEANPAIVAIVNSFIKLLMPLYILAIILTGLYLLFASSSPGGRAKAKGIFWRLLFSIVLIPLSLPLFQIILNVSAALTSGIANIMNLNILYVLFPFNLFLAGIIAAFSDPTLLTIAGAWILFFNVLILFIVAARYVILLILAMLFPFTIFLWYLDFPLTKAFGMNLMRWTYMWAFMSVVFVLVAGASQIAMSDYYDNCSVMTDLGVTGGVALTVGVFNKIIVEKVLLSETQKIAKKAGVDVIGAPKGLGIGTILGTGMIFGLLTERDCAMTIFLSFAGTLLMITTPLMMIGLTKWIGGAMVMYGLTQFKKPHGELFTLAGGILSGMGPGAVILYGTQSFWRKAGIQLAPLTPDELKRDRASGMLTKLHPGQATQEDIINAIWDKDAVRRKILGGGHREFEEYNKLKELQTRGLTTSDSKRFAELDKKFKNIDEFFSLRKVESGETQASLLPSGKTRLTELERQFGSDRVRRLNEYENRINGFTDQAKEDHLKLVSPYYGDLAEEKLKDLYGLRAKGKLEKLETPTEIDRLNELKLKASLSDDESKELYYLRKKPTRTPDDELRLNNLRRGLDDKELEDFNKLIEKDEVGRLKKLKEEIGDEGLKKLDELDRNIYWGVRELRGEFDTWEFRDVVKIKGRKAGGLVKRGIGRGLGYIQGKIRKPPVTP